MGGAKLSGGRADKDFEAKPLGEREFAMPEAGRADTVMNVHRITLLGLAGILAGSLACEMGVEKSANPLSPAIAGPLPGVAITPPYPREPVNGVEVLTTSLPVKLTFENSQSNSPRPFWYVVEVATSSNFSTKVYTSAKVSPDASGRTTHMVPGQLPDDVTYYWRVQALDGANSSEPSTVVHFLVVQPTIIDPPVPASPIGGATTPNRSPNFVVTNGRVSGPAGVVTYYFEVANDAGFGSMAATGATPRGGGATTTVNLGQFAENKTFYWRTFGSNGKVTSARSLVQSFKTPVTTPPPPPPGGSCGPPYPNEPLPIVECRRRQYGHMSRSETVAFLKAVARDLNAANISGGPFGLLPKTSGNNCEGYSCDIICTKHEGWDVLADWDGAQTPTWGSKGGPAPSCEIQP